jgi:hypothetical protein
MPYNQFDKIDGVQKEQQRPQNEYLRHDGL